MAPYSLLVTRLQVSELREVGLRGRGASCLACGCRRGQAWRAGRAIDFSCTCRGCRPSALVRSCVVLGQGVPGTVRSESSSPPARKLESKQLQPGQGWRLSFFSGGLSPCSPGWFSVLQGEDKVIGGRGSCGFLQAGCLKPSLPISSRDLSPYVSVVGGLGVCRSYIHYYPLRTLGVIDARECLQGPTMINSRDNGAFSPMHQMSGLFTNVTDILSDDIDVR